jgi:competence protein ComK
MSCFLFIIINGKEEILMVKTLQTFDYEINPLTMAVLSERDASGCYVTRVLEEEAEYVVDYTPSRLIEYACKFFGSSLKGRQEGTRDICGITHKAPISIDPSSGMYYFPTTSPTSSTCSWIAHSHIDKMRKAETSGTEIIFKNSKKIHVEVSYGSLLNQIQRTAQLRFLLDNRLKFLQQRSELVAEHSPSAHE